MTITQAIAKVLSSLDYGIGKQFETDALSVFMDIWTCDGEDTPVMFHVDTHMGLSILGYRQRQIVRNMAHYSFLVFPRGGDFLKEHRLFSRPLAEIMEDTPTSVLWKSLTCSKPWGKWEAHAKRELDVIFDIEMFPNSEPVIYPKETPNDIMASTTHMYVTENIT